MRVDIVRIAFALCFLTGIVSRATQAGTAKVTALVIDDASGLPIPNVSVTAAFENNNGWEAWTRSAPINRDIGKTDINGMCALTGRTNNGRAGCCVEEPPTGYYQAGGRHFRFSSRDLSGVWQPDNLVATIRLQRVEHPIPLDVRRIGDHVNLRKTGNFDGTNTVLKFDFVAGDYLPPNGQGKVADMIICSALESVESTYKLRRCMSYFDFSNTMSFPGNGNGIIVKMSRPTDGIKLRVAPEIGYVPSTVLHCGVRKTITGPNIRQREYTDTDPNRCYYFRIRSEYDGKGNLVGGYYGKIYEDFKLGFNLKTGCSVEFVYYLNPNALDRNLEWDCRHNLADENVDKKKRRRAPPCMP